MTIASMDQIQMRTLLQSRWTIKKKCRKPKEEESQMANGDRQSFDEEVDMVLENASGDAVDCKIEAMAFIICTMGSGRLGTEYNEAKPLVTEDNRRTIKISALRRELYQQTEQYRQAYAEEQQGIKCNINIKVSHPVAQW